MTSVNIDQIHFILEKKYWLKIYLLYYADTVALTELEQKLEMAERNFDEQTLDRQIEEMRQARIIQVILNLQNLKSDTHSS